MRISSYQAGVKTKTYRGVDYWPLWQEIHERQMMLLRQYGFQRYAEQGAKYLDEQKAQQVEAPEIVSGYGTLSAPTSAGRGDT